MENVQTIPPPYVVRTVLIYSRHAGPLQFNPSEAVGVSITLPRDLPPVWVVVYTFSVILD